jgi:hypothetical protein
MAMLLHWYLVTFSTLKMEAICSSETSADFQWDTWHYIPEDGTLNNRRCGYLKSYRKKITNSVELSFLRSRQSPSYSRICQYFMGPEDSLPCSQEPSNSLYPESDQSSPYHSIANKNVVRVTTHRLPFL